MEKEFVTTQDICSGIYHHSKDAMGFVSQDGLLLDVNDSFCRLTGYSREELIARKKYQDLTPGEYHEYEARVIETILRTGEPAEYEKEYVRKDGSLVPILLTTFVVKGYDGQPLGLAAIIKDISRRKQAEQALEESQSRYRDIFNYASDVIIIRDLKGNINEANQAAATLTGYTLEELTKMNLSQLLSAESLRLTMKSQQVLLRGETTSQRYDLDLIRKDGTGKTVESVTGLIIKNGQPVGIQAMVRDVSEQRRLRENMQFYISEITRAQEEERKRIARELHDDTTQGLAALLLDIQAVGSTGNGLSDETRRRLEQLKARTNSILEGVRRFSHELRPDVLDRLGLLPALELLTAELNKTEVSTHIEVTGSERRLSPEVELVLFRIAQEALRNVRKHSLATEALVRVEFAEKKVKLTVSDNGRGFESPRAPGDLVSKGKLGLVGMQERARLLGGSLSVISQPGEGTTVMVKITT